METKPIIYWTRIALCVLLYPIAYVVGTVVDTCYVGYRDGRIHSWDFYKELKNGR